MGSEEEKQFIQLFWHECYRDESIAVQPIMVSRQEQIPVTHWGSQD